MQLQKISPFLWFDTNAEEAVNHYVSIFKNATVGKTMRYGDAGPGPKGSVLTMEFELEGLHFTALNGGPMYKFTPAVSFVVTCDAQDEVDYYWNGLLAGGGREQQCAWLVDKFGLSWQIVPKVLLELLGDKDPARANRVMQAMLQMTKIEIPKLQAAYNG